MKCTRKGRVRGIYAAYAHYSHAKGVWNAETEIVRGVEQGCENEVSVKTNLQVMSKLKNRATQQFARVATHEVFPKLKGYNPNSMLFIE